MSRFSGDTFSGPLAVAATSFAWPEAQEKPAREIRSGAAIQAVNVHANTRALNICRGRRDHVPGGSALAKKKPRQKAGPNLAQKLVICEQNGSLATAWIDGRRKRQHDRIDHVDDAVRSRNVRHDDVSAATELIREDAVGLFETRAKQGAYRIP